MKYSQATDYALHAMLYLAYREDISFLDAIQAIEGTASLFECSLDQMSV